MLRKVNDPIWKIACEKLENRIERHDLYCSVQSNVHNLLQRLENFQKITKSNIQNIKYLASDSEEEEDAETEAIAEISDCNDYFNMSIEERNPQKCDPLEFIIHIDEKHWDEIKPIKKVYADHREYQNLKDGWGHVIAKKIWKDEKVPCPYSFKKDHVYTLQDYPFFDFYGFCKECKTYIYGKCSNDFSVNSKTVDIKISTFNTKHIAHKRKRKFAGKVAAKGRKELKYVKAKYYRLKKSKEYLSYGDVEAPILQTTINYRKNRQRAIEKHLKLSGPIKVYDSLLHLKTKFPEIKQVQKYPFIIKYWTDEQILIWKDLSNRGRLSLSIDASGSFCKNVNMPEHKTGHLFFYVVVTGIYSKIIPLLQMLTEKHDTNTAKLWLLDAKLSGAPDPEEVITDGSQSLLNAVCLAYNECSYREYLDTCFQFLQKQIDELRPVYVRLDKAHAIKAATLWKCFEKKDNRVKDFYLRCIGYSVNCVEFKVLEDDCCLCLLYQRV